MSKFRHNKVSRTANEEPLSGEPLKTIVSAMSTSVGHDRCVPQNASSDVYCLESYLRTVKLSLVAFGMFNHRRRTPEGSAGDRRNTLHHCISTTTVYNVVVPSLLWGNFIRSVLSFCIGNRDRSFNTLRVVAAVWIFQVCVTASVLVKASHPKYGHLDKLFKFWRESIMNKLSALPISTATPLSSRKVAVSVVMIWTCVVINVLCAALMAFLPFGTLHDFVEPIFISPAPVNIYSTVTMLIVHLFDSVAWLIPMLYFGILSTAMATAFSACSSALRKDIRERTGHFPVNLQDKRALHLNLCRAVDIANQDLKYIYANWYGTNIPLACFILYSILNYSMETFSLCLHIFWLVSSIVSIIVASAFAANLHEKAHSQLDSVYEISLNGVSVEQLGQVQLFLSKLTSKSTGFTVMDFVLVTKELLLTVGGLYITYFIVLLQF